MARKDMKRYSLEELKALRASGKTRTRADAPVREIDKDFWEHAHVVMPGTGKTSVHLRVDRSFARARHDHVSVLPEIFVDLADWGVGARARFAAGPQRLKFFERVTLHIFSCHLRLPSMR